MNSWHLYTNITFLYGAFHAMMNMPKKCTYTHHITHQEEEKTILLSHEMGNVLLGAGLGPILWPVMMRDDITRLECLICGKDPAQYGKKLSIFN